MDAPESLPEPRKPAASVPPSDVPPMAAVPPYAGPKMEPVPPSAAAPSAPTIGGFKPGSREGTLFERMKALAGTPAVATHGMPARQAQTLLQHYEQMLTPGLPHGEIFKSLSDFHQLVRHAEVNYGVTLDPTTVSLQPLAQGHVPFSSNGIFASLRQVPVVVPNTAVVSPHGNPLREVVGGQLRSAPAAANALETSPSMPRPDGFAVPDWNTLGKPVTPAEIATAIPAKSAVASAAAKAATQAPIASVAERQAALKAAQASREQHGARFAKLTEFQTKVQTAPPAPVPPVPITPPPVPPAPVLTMPPVKVPAVVETAAGAEKMERWEAFLTGDKGRFTRLVDGPTTAATPAAPSLPGQPVPPLVPPVPVPPAPPIPVPPVPPVPVPPAAAATEATWFSKLFRRAPNAVEAIEHAAETSGSKRNALIGAVVLSATAVGAYLLLRERPKPERPTLAERMRMRQQQAFGQNEQDEGPSR